MPAILDWVLRLGPTNPISTRLVQTGSRRVRHLTIRSAYLGALMVVLLFGLLGDTGTLREMAQRGAAAFTIISFGQVLLICLLTPVFMAGAIAQEANAQTWDILLTSPLNSLQVVLGNLFGRLFFIIALLLSTLPVFAVTQFFGGVPGEAIFDSFAISGCSALIVAAIAITLSVTRTAGRRAVFIFYISVVLYLFVTWALDSLFRTPISPGSAAQGTTLLTPLNPFLAMESLLLSNSYVPLIDSQASWFKQLWFGHPLAVYCWLCVLLSLMLVGLSTVRLRVIGSRSSVGSRLGRIFKKTESGARAPRRVGHNPIAWWEHDGRGRTLTAVISRWSFFAIGITAAVVLLLLYAQASISVQTLRVSFLTLLAAETVVIMLTALNLSATAVSREREDGTLDLILTTPIQPGPYLAGKLKGLIQNLLPMILVPSISLGLAALFVLIGGFGQPTSVLTMINTNNVMLPIVLPESALVFPFLLTGFTAFCVMVGLHWSIKSRGTIGSITASVAVVFLVGGVLGICGVTSGREIDVVGGFLSALSPINLLLACFEPGEFLNGSLESGNESASRISLVIGGAVASFCYIAVVFGMHSSMKRSFMMSVRRLAGTGN
ncbi:MAG: ABC transporter permease subunit [Phycisphaerales bacterium]|jgi:ABC-type transport system involved in multi-copper enzyme maturation permease subunit|nr:ABC transporter permease subunit [Phycisphaerales bacterium]